MTINPTSQPVTETARTHPVSGAQPAAAAGPATDRMQAMIYTRFGPIKLD